MNLVQVEVPGRSRPVTCTTQMPDLDVGDRLLVEIEGRTAFGCVVRVPLDLDWEGRAAPGRVLRRASRNDEERESHIEAKRDEWLTIAREKVLEHELPMRVLRADVTPSARKVTYSFVAEGRVDFRELVRDLSRHLRTRVELRQIGVRDASILQGGYGHCGERLCCASHLGGFAPVSMRMAKAQGLPLNPAKISGQCGRLMCCLRYELDEPDRRRAPSSARGGQGGQGASAEGKQGQGGRRADGGGPSGRGRGRRGRRGSRSGANKGNNRGPGRGDGRGGGGDDPKSPGTKE